MLWHVFGAIQNYCLVCSLGRTGSHHTVGIKFLPLQKIFFLLVKSYGMKNKLIPVCRQIWKELFLHIENSALDPFGQMPNDLGLEAVWIFGKFVI